MVSRGIWQLYKVNLRFCKHGGSSKGVRELLDTEVLDSWLEENTSINLTAFQVNGVHPYIQTFYKNGWERSMSLKNLGADEVMEILQRARDQIGHVAYKHSGHAVINQRPSIQGEWQHAFWNRAHNFEIAKAVQLP